MDYKTEILLSIIGVAAVLMVVTAPTLENQQALAVSQPVVKKVNVKDPPIKGKKVIVKFPPRKRFVKRCVITRFGKRVCRLVPRFGPPVVGPRPVPPIARPPVVGPRPIPPVTKLY